MQIPKSQSDLSLPLGVRNVVYSYLTILELLDTISFLSVKDRESIVKFNDKPLNLSIVMCNIYPVKLKNMKHAVKLSSFIEIVISKQLTEMNKICMQVILSKAVKYKKRLGIKLEGQFKL